MAYSPEREDPGRKDASVKTIPKVVGGFTPKCTELAEVLYGHALDKIHLFPPVKLLKQPSFWKMFFEA